MRLRLFERVRRLRHARPRKDMLWRGQAGVTARRDRAGKARFRGRAPDTHAAVEAWGTAEQRAAGEQRGAGPAADPDAVGKHRRENLLPPEPPSPGVGNSRIRPYVGDPQDEPPVYPQDTRPVRPQDARPVYPQDARPVRPRDASPGAASPGGGRARIRDAPRDAAAAPPPPASAVAPPATQKEWYQVVGDQAAGRTSLAAPRKPEQGSARGRTRSALRARLPFASARPRGQPSLADGRRNCGTLESVIWRQWDTAVQPPPEVVTAIDRLAEFPQKIKEKLAAGLDGIFVGPGGVPDLDEMTSLHGVPLPSGRATWDACAGAYGERKIVVGTRSSPTPDVMCHEVGHALDDLDSSAGKWQSDSAEFRMLYDQCQPHLASDFHRQRGGLGRKEFFADAFAAIASQQRPALVDMLGGDTRTALNVMLYFNRRYGI